MRTTAAKTNPETRLNTYGINTNSKNTIPLPYKRAFTR
jgi:hypothetical protein